MRNRDAKSVAVALWLAGMSLSGCAAIKGAPDEPPSLPSTVVSLDAATLQRVITEYYNTTTAENRKRQLRNQIVYSDISQIDQSFNRFRIELNSQANSLAIGTDLTVLALAGLGATLSGANTKAALAAAAAGVLGAKASVDKDLLYQKTITALVTEMEAQRTLVYARIISRLNQGTAQYPLEQASKDLQDYFKAGSLLSALDGIGRSAGAKAEQAQAEVSRILSANYNYTAASTQLEQIWMPDGKTIDQGKDGAIKACMGQAGVEGTIPFLINAGKDEDRTKVLNCVQQKR